MAARERIEKVQDDTTSVVERRRLQEGLAIDKHALDDALINQPTLFFDVAEELAYAVSRRDAAKQALKVAEAEADMSIREAAVNNGEKLSETQIAKLVLADSYVVDAHKKLLKHEENVDKMTALRDAFLQRSYALKELVSLHLASYYSKNSDSRLGTDLLANRAKDAMNRARRGYD